MKLQDGSILTGYYTYRINLKGDGPAAPARNAPIPRHNGDDTGELVCWRVPDHWLPTPEERQSRLKHTSQIDTPEVRIACSGLLVLALRARFEGGLQRQVTGLIVHSVVARVDPVEDASQRLHIYVVQLIPTSGLGTSPFAMTSHCGSECFVWVPLALSLLVTPIYFDRFTSAHRAAVEHDISAKVDP